MSALESAAIASARLASARLAGMQAPDGHWRAELTGDSTLESDYVLFQLWLYPPSAGRWEPPTRPLVDKAVRAIWNRQLADGGFGLYAGGPAEVNASVKAYAALKLGGAGAEDPRIARLRDRILALGGLEAANSLVKVNLSFFGLYPRELCPSIPPEMVLMPGRALYQVSCWTRTLLVPLAIVQAAGRPRPVPEGFGLDELLAGGTACPTFPALDKLLKWWEKHGSQSIRRKAIRASEKWMVERLEHSDGLGAIYPAMMYSVMALDTLDYAADHPLRAAALRQFDRLMVDDGERFFFQPCFTPVWDTALAAYALEQGGEADPAALRRAADWLLAREIRRPGDWAARRPHAEPSGWAMGYRNEFYPNIDSTSMALVALSRARSSDAQAQQECQRRAIAWLLAMQSRDGGWAAFDADGNRRVRFADPWPDIPSADTTGRALEALAAHGLGRDHPAVRRGVEWLVRHQEDDGSWGGRWGVAFLHGACFALRGLAAAGESDREAYVLRGGEWLRSIQNADGGWGESCASYDHGQFVPGPSAPSQTAWAIMGLVAGGDADSLSVRHGIEYLVETQRPGGGWAEESATGTGFPQVFYLNHSLCRDYFPILALAAFAHARTGPTG
jgi:squalene-hopene/tetraprenyl-beta-curcumene cyclase